MMYNRIPLSIEVKKVLKLLVYTLLGLLIVTSGYFFAKMSNNSEKGYLLRDNQILQKTLESENRILKQRVLDAQSIQRLSDSEIVKDMEQPQNQMYVLPRGPLSKRK